MRIEVSLEEWVRHPETKRFNLTVDFKQMRIKYEFTVRGAITDNANFKLFVNGSMINLPNRSQHFWIMKMFEKKIHDKTT